MARRPRRPQTTLLFLACLGMLSVSASTPAGKGCVLPGLGKKDTWTGDQLGAASIEVVKLNAFKGSVYTYTRAQCMSCHAAIQAPTFASSDAVLAYGLSKPRANFAVPASSTLVNRVKDGHCGAPCLTNGDAMTGHIQTWADVENPPSSGAPTPPPMTTDTVTSPALSLPNNLPTGNNFTTLRWNLTTATPANPDLAGVLFEIEIQQFTTAANGFPGSLRIRRPRLATPTNALHVKGIRILQNGTFDPSANDYVGVERVISAGTIPANLPLPFPVLSADEMLIVLDQPGTPMLSVSFEILVKAVAPACKALTGFTTAVKPVMQSSCVSCHAQNGNQAQRRFNMGTTPDATLCALALQRTIPTDPLKSPLITNPLNGKNGHNQINGFPAAADAWVQWIQSEL